MLQNKIDRILEEIKAMGETPSADVTLPQETFYLNDEKILALPRKGGESRFPYDADGFVVWAYQTGYITACDSIFTILRSSNYGEDPVVGFFAGIEKENGEFFPVSITGACRQLDEPCDVKRYVVFSLRCVYYIVDTDEFTFGCRMNVTRDKHIHFSVTAKNKAAGERRIYIASFLEALLRFDESEGFWDRMSKYGIYKDGSYLLWSLNGREDCLAVNPKIVEGEVKAKYVTSARGVFLGYKGRTLATAESLKTGKMEKEVYYANTTELPVACEINHFALGAGESARIDFDLVVRHGLEEGKAEMGRDFDVSAIENEIEEWEKEDKGLFDNMQVKFEDWDTDAVNPAVFNKFIRNVQKQVSFCALGKNYAGPHIGIRDVFQQLEGSLMWDPAKSREKILVAMNYIMNNGRAPRQFSIPNDPKSVPDFDLRMYIDQGVWVISTIYTYIAHTDDWSILDEECGYYQLVDNQWAAMCDERDSVLSHLVRICDFLASNIDAKTGCMRALYGDWNDALDGLGRTKDEGKDYGDGVSVMTSLQYYMNLGEMDDMIRRHDGFEDKLEGYAALRENLKEGLFKFAVEKDENGVRRVIHGWGDKMSYKVGSLCDFDGKARYSLTANSFWAISGMLANDPTMKEAITGCADAVKSKYGLKTFDEPFCLADRPYIGRLATITKGTYENSCAYVHASMFGIMALFMVGQAERAWREMEKSIVITHDNCTMTSFVMPNSYCHNEELYIDGVSMGDWYTGSGTMLVKELIRFGFGIEPSLDGLYVQTPSFMPTTKATLEMKIKGKAVSFEYRKDGGERKYFVDGKEVKGEYSELMGTYRVFVPTAEIKEGMKIEVID